MSSPPRAARPFRPQLEALENRELLSATVPSGYSSSSAASLLAATGLSSAGGTSGGSFSIASLAPFVSSPQALNAALGSIPGPQAAYLKAAFDNLTTGQQSLATQVLSSNLTTPATPIAYGLSGATVPVFKGLATANELRVALINDQVTLFNDFNAGASPSTLASDYKKAGSDYSQIQSLNSSLQSEIKTDQVTLAAAAQLGNLNVTDTLMLEFSVNAVTNSSKALNQDIKIANEVANAPGPAGLPTIASGQGNNL
jgi:hypothetical protein